ncbi:NGG1p interacting factor NIF3 [Oceanispirochaeta crateris]|uniref:NGG1p interacting factor NIF3 n=2 Tax=Oceanispirochaeta crateris TaxID=2518645 RepID=A0A5C1QSC0_9SPIO|nr:NGG1p interacting factor NIF3 [Oceanispirochaeta crateris]
MKGMYKLVFFVPSEGKEKLKNALFDAGAGALGNYSRCCWECEGRGQFLPGRGSQPVIGLENELEILNEFRVEMLVPEELVSICIDTLRANHPYEEPAFEFTKVFISESELEGQEWL